MIRLTFLQAVLDGVAAFIAHGIAAHAVVLPKPMRKPVFILGTDAAVALYALSKWMDPFHHTPYHHSIGQRSAEYENSVPIGTLNAKKTSLFSQTRFLLY